MSDLSKFREIIDEIDDGEEPIELEDRDKAQRLSWALHFTERDLAQVEADYEGDINTLISRRDTAASPLRERVQFLSSQLENWHRAVFADAQAKGERLPKTVKLKGAVLSSNAGGTSTVVDEEDVLIGWLRANGHHKVVVEKTSVSKTELKKLMVDGKPVTVDGELIPGVKLVTGDRNFTVKKGDD